MTLQLKNSVNTVISSGTVDLPLETMVVNARYDDATKKIILILQNGTEIEFSVADLVSGLQTEITSENKLASDLVDDTNQTNKFVTSGEKTSWNAKYDKPNGGIPKADLSSEVQTSLSKADTAIQQHQDISGKEDKSNKVTELTSSSTDTQYPTAKAVYDSQQEQNEIIEALQEENAELKVKVQDLQNNRLTDTAQGESIDLSDSADSEVVSIESKGNSKQETTNGYNIINISDISYTTAGVTISSTDGTRFKLNGTASSAINFEINPRIAKTITGNYTLSLRYISGTKNGGSNFSVRDVSTSNALSYVGFGTADATKTSEYNNNSIKYKIYADSGTVFTNYEFAIMLEEGSTAHDWEKYTNGASPNPSYEQPISSCGDNVNLFDKDNANILNANIGNNVIGDAPNARTLYIPCKANTTYTMQKKAGQRFQLACTSVLPAIGVSVENLQYYQTASSITITTTSNAQYLVAFFFLSTADTIPYQEMLDSIKIEQGSKATPYSPYNQGVITENVVNKNIAKVELTNSYRRYQTGVIQSNVDYDGYIAVVKEQTNYICSKSSGNDTEISNLVFFDKNMIYISGVAFTSNDKKFTTPENCKYVTLAVSHNITDFMIEQGSTATTYVEHQEQNYSIYTQQSFRSIGNVRDVFIKKSDGNWYERHNIFRKIFNGTENWQLGANGTNPYYLYLGNALIDENAITVLCNNFKGVKYTDRAIAKNNIVYINSANNTIYVRNTDFTTTEAFKADLAQKYASGNPVYADYQLAEPTLLPCTEQQTEQLEAFIKARTYKNVTHIYSEDTISPVIDLVYVQDLRTILNS